MTVVYLDGVFLVNGVTDYLILLLTACLAGLPLRRRRYVQAALAGAVYAVAVFLPGLAFLGTAPVRLTAGAALAWIAFGREARFLRLTVLMLAVSCALAGSVFGLGMWCGKTGTLGLPPAGIRTAALLLAAAAAYGTFGVVFRGAAHHGLEGDLLSVRVCVQGRITELTALRDSGNALREEETGAPVLVAAPEAACRILPPELRELPDPDRLRRPAELAELLAEREPALFPRLLPFRTVGCANGSMAAIRTDWIEIRGMRTEGVCMAISPVELGTGYGALWGGPVRKGGAYENFPEPSAMDQKTVGTGTSGIRSLHRWQRYAAAASDEGAGGGTFEPDGGGIRPKGTDRA